MIMRRLTANHDYQFGRSQSDLASDAEATAQSVRTRLLMLLGEWFLDTGAGVPHLQSIMVKPANFPLAEALIKKTILETVGVKSLNDFSLIFDPNTRKMTVNASVSTIYEDISSIKVVIG